MALSSQRGSLAGLTVNYTPDFRLVDGDEVNPVLALTAFKLHAAFRLLKAGSCAHGTSCAVLWGWVWGLAAHSSERWGKMSKQWLLYI